MEGHNLLLDELPKSITVDGAEYAINWRFRAMILFELIMLDTEMDDTEKLMWALQSFYADMDTDPPAVSIPPDIGAAIETMNRFYNGFKDAQPSGKHSSESPAQKDAIYSYECDGEYIYAAFLQQYGIDLEKANDLHWFQFRALFHALNGDCKFVEMMQIRSIDLKDIESAHMRKHYEKMKRTYMLPFSRNEREKEDEIRAILKGDGDLSKLRLKER